ncbi:cell division protein FtsK [Pelagibaculum spongiae]|uniref:DNA translocase FtsK n=1 Tax=Pelagibaculum spongiae TaxID=2080658 RepID=A0A2V1H0K1_9GAMM|nr:DNA translocase FtsK [Pelagibaculum spongiae]PVZ71490.1 cell division protein FtsK [Pelagibaculum spongiae]
MRLTEALVILLLALGCFLFLALISYSSQDPGWSHTGFNAQITNWAGSSGAWFADLAFFLFGFCAYGLPLAVALLAWKLGRHKLQSLSEDDYFLLSIRLAGACLVLLTAPAIEFIYFQNMLSWLPNGPGGVLGTGSTHWLMDSLNLAGASILLWAVLLTGVTLLTGFSWLGFVDNLGSKAIELLEKLKQFQRDRTEKLQLEKTEAEKLQAEDLSIGKIISDPLRVNNPLVEKQSLRQKRKEMFPRQPSGDVPLETASPEIIPPAKPVEKSKRAIKEQQKDLFPEDQSGNPLPPLSLLDIAGTTDRKQIAPEALDAMSRLVECKLLEFNIEARVIEVHPGPVITRFEMELAPGIKVSKVSNLSKDLARSLSVTSVRIVEVIPGKPYVGLEIPNEQREIVRLSEILSSDVFEKASSPLSMGLGKDISGESIVVDLAKMPHLLVAGTTGSGKSVGLNAMLLSLLYKAGPDEVRLIMIDPKMLELAVYDGIPHLLCPVVTDMKEAASALRWCVGEMERRYKLMATLGVRNINGFNRKVTDAQEAGQPLFDPLWNPEQGGDSAPELEALPYIVVVVDEFADMMMIVGKKVEELIARIAQKARAAGIHLILATQRPSVDVITGLIKANVPTRMAFQVSSRIDSRTILDQQGAEQLLGMGDMLYLPPGTSHTLRVHGAFVADDEVHKVVQDWKSRGEPDYLEDILDESASNAVFLPGEQSSESGGEMDPLYDEAVQIVLDSRRASISSVQRRLKIGYNRAARLIEDMEAAGLVSQMQTNGQREVLVPSRKE